MSLHSADPGGGKRKAQKSVLLSNGNKQDDARATDSAQAGAPETAGATQKHAGAAVGLGTTTVGLGTATQHPEAALHHNNHGRDVPRPQRRLALEQQTQQLKQKFQ